VTATTKPCETCGAIGTHTPDCVHLSEKLRSLARTHVGKLPASEDGRLASYPPPDGTRDGDGYWQNGKWHPDDQQYAAQQSVEKNHSRRVQFDKYHAMQGLLNTIANAPERLVAKEYVDRAKEILAGMTVPRGPAIRARERADELEALVFAYRVPERVLAAEGPIAQRAATLTVEALKAWERAHPPQPLDPLLLPK